MQEVDYNYSEVDRVVAAAVAAVHRSYRIAVVELVAVGCSLDDHCKVISDIHVHFANSFVAQEVVGRKVEVPDNSVLKEHNPVVLLLNSAVERLKDRVRRFHEPVAQDIADKNSPSWFMVMQATKNK